MQLDQDLLNQLSSDPILHLYRWEKPSATYGYFIKPEEIFVLENLKKHGIDIARRPTGGGVVFHIWDLAFSFLMPSEHKAFSNNPLENYQFVNKVVLHSMKEFMQKYTNITLIAQSYATQDSRLQNFCMARPTIYDVILENKKIAGAAQRKKKQGYLHQGTISLTTPSVDLLKNVLQNAEPIIEAMMLYTAVPLGSSPSEESLEIARKQVELLLQKNFEEALLKQL